MYLYLVVFSDVFSDVLGLVGRHKGGICTVVEEGIGV